MNLGHMMSITETGCKRIHLFRRKRAAVNPVHASPGPVIRPLLLLLEDWAVSVPIQSSTIINDSPRYLSNEQAWNELLRAEQSLCLEEDMWSHIPAPSFSKLIREKQMLSPVRAQQVNLWSPHHPWLQPVSSWKNWDSKCTKHLMSWIWKCDLEPNPPLQIQRHLH